ncbi:pentapeptide repeat-containing protein [Escherichia fergusonii]|uniref:pentapeptide repeat-containing protein n=1 Tax=Escherichia fergusonii TaxID=564 RepID=UPI0024339B6B|nr:pentapeptide repeat-containing protein [Escherichia fergusonii]WGA65295.1 pentapeptide repeat-containing protein [Escherichia fergusonii]
MMSLTLNVNHGQQISACTLNDSRVKRMMSGNHDTAVHMGLWDRFKDWFRIEKKAEALENLYKLLYPTPEDTEVSGLPGAVDNNEGKKYTSSLYAFRKLKALISDQSVSKSVNWTISLDVNNCLKTTFHFGNVVIEHQAIQLSSTGERPDLRGADLRGANLSGASLLGACLYGADLRSADLSFADLHNARLHGANLRNTNMHCVRLYGADLSFAIV